MLQQCYFNLLIEHFSRVVLVIQRHFNNSARVQTNMPRIGDRNVKVSFLDYYILQSVCFLSKVSEIVEIVNNYYRYNVFVCPMTTFDTLVGHT